MVLKLAKSPLVISIGGVGAIAATLLALTYLREAPAAPAAPDLLLNNLSLSPWQQGKDLGWQAAVAAQTAQSQSEWQQVTDLWDQAIAALQSVPAGDVDYAQAQAKVEEYRGNRAIAANRQAAASAAAPGSTAGLATTTAGLQTALAASDLAFTFTPGPADRTVGKSADGLATVELAGDRATLVLPRTAQDTALSMAQVVYARQFLALAAPGASAQPWLLESLRTAQSDQPQPTPADAPVTLSVGPGSLSITVVSGTGVSAPSPQP